MLSVQYCKLNVPSVQWRNQNDNWGGGGGIFIYSCSHTIKTIDFKEIN
jgi:hypothetical protein